MGMGVGVGKGLGTGGRGGAREKGERMCSFVRGGVVVVLS